ncbi:MAG: hypothetical protein Q7T81_06425 [Pseudolabrys sp.]|nr:hypothetical protein [Pseudolabrys sp.]
MIRKILTALAAVAVLSSGALVTTSASAAPQKQFNNKFINKLPPKTVHPHFPKQPPKFAHFPKQQGPKIVHWHKPPMVVHKPVFVHVPVVRNVPVAYAAKPVRAVAGPCTCLTKQYTPEGAVVFKDICTNEAAINPPPQPPQQTGMLQAQPEAQVQPQQQ